MLEGRGGTCYICTITSSNDETTVKHKLHVAGPAGLGTSSRDMLADIRSGAQNLCLADIVVLDEDNLEQIADILVIIHNCTDLVD